jgi:hypothetical protein
VRQGIAEVDQQAVAEILRDMPLKAANHLGASRLIGSHHLTQFLWVELASERRRVHQITKQHRELAAFGFRRTRLCSLLGQLNLWNLRRWCGWRGPVQWF